MRLSLHTRLAGEATPPPEHGKDPIDQVIQRNNKTSQVQRQVLKVFVVIGCENKIQGVSKKIEVDKQHWEWRCRHGILRLRQQVCMHAVVTTFWDSMGQGNREDGLQFEARRVGEGGEKKEN